MTAAVLYCRVSTEDQDLSIAAQTSNLTAYAALKGLSVLEVVVDRGVSGGVPMSKRPGGRRVAQLVKEKRVSAVCCAKLDRAFRSASDCLSVVSVWEKQNVSLHLLDLALDTSTPTGKFFLSVLASTAELERGLIRERVKTALTHKKTKKERISGHPPYGFCFEGGVVVKNEQEQKVLSKVRTLSRLGYSSNKIATLLNREGFCARGSRFYGTTISRMLTA